jgi:phage pi2 protein 07
MSSKCQGPSREFKLRQRAYVVKVREDTKLPGHAKLVCWVVSEHWNEKSGDAFLSTNTIAKEAGISQTNVRNMLKHPRMQIYMRIEIGGRGSGHPNRYWPIEHPSAQSEAPIEQFSPPIEHPSAMNHINHSAPPARSSEYVDRDDLTEPEPQPEISARERAYYTTSGVHPKGPNTVAEDNQCKAIFFEALDRGIDQEEIISAAERCDEHHAEPLIDWLRNERWKEQRG